MASTKILIWLIITLLPSVGIAASIIADFDDGAELVCVGTSPSITCVDDRSSYIMSDWGYSVQFVDPNYRQLYTHETNPYMTIDWVDYDQTDGPDYGYWDIDNSKSAKGTRGSLKIVATGDQDYIATKEAALNNPSYIGTGTGGGIYFDIAKGDGINDYGYDFPQLQGKERLSFYIHLPSEFTAFQEPNTSHYQYNLHIGTSACPDADEPCYDRDGCNATWNGEPCDGSSSHFYHWGILGLRGGAGGWTHVLVSEHPDHERYDNWNGENDPTQNTFGEDYFNSITRIYFDTVNRDYTGEGSPPGTSNLVDTPFSVWVDEIEALDISEFAEQTQNEDTISTVMVGYYPDNSGRTSNPWEISFTQGECLGIGTYEIKYSLTDFTNSNYSTNGSYITPQNSTITSCTGGGGCVGKLNIGQCYDFYNTSFDLPANFETAGTTVYFAIKDISSNGNNYCSAIDSNNTRTSTNSNIHTTMFTVPSDYTDAIDGLSQGQWAALSGTALGDTTAAPSTECINNPEPTPGIMLPWSGGAFDVIRNRLLLHGGGHGDAPDNGLYAFDLDDLAWYRVWGPSSWPSNQSNCCYEKGSCTDTYTDGHPASVHTYGSLIFDEDNDAFIRTGGSLCCSGGSGTTAVWSIDPYDAPASWTSRTASPSNSLYKYCARNQTTNKTWCVIANQLYEYTYPNTWTSRGSPMAGINEDRLSAAIDETNNVLVISGEGKLYTWNLGTYAYTDKSSSSTGNKTAQNSGDAAITWDSDSEQIVAMVGNSTTVYTLNTSTWAWAAQSCTGSAPVTTDYIDGQDQDQGGGVYGRFAYSAERNVFVYAPNCDANVFVLKTPFEEGEDTTDPVVVISTSDPSNIVVDSLSAEGTASDANGVDECKYRIGSAPDEDNGTACSGTTAWTCATSGYSPGANTLYVGCADPSNNWGSDSIVVNYNPIAAPIITGVGTSVIKTGGTAVLQ